MVSTPTDPDRLVDQLFRVLRYALIGVCATLVHAAILWLLVTFADLRPSFATIVGFLAAFNVSYFGHYHFTFHSTEPHHRALPRFFAVALSGAVLNWLIFFIVNDGFGIDYWVAFLIAVFVVPIFVFAMSGRLAFKKVDGEVPSLKQN